MHYAWELGPWSEVSPAPVPGPYKIAISCVDEKILESREPLCKEGSQKLPEFSRLDTVMVKVVTHSIKKKTEGLCLCR